MTGHLAARSDANVASTGPRPWIRTQYAYAIGGAKVVSTNECLVRTIPQLPGASREPGARYRVSRSGVGQRRIWSQAQWLRRDSANLLISFVITVSALRPRIGGGFGPAMTNPRYKSTRSPTRGLMVRELHEFLSAQPATSPATVAVPLDRRRSGRPGFLE